MCVTSRPVQIKFSLKPSWATRYSFLGKPLTGAGFHFFSSIALPGAFISLEPSSAHMLVPEVNERERRRL